MSIKLYNMQFGIDMPQEDSIEMAGDNDVLALKSVASLSTISFGGSATDSPSTLDRIMFYTLDESVRSQLALVENSKDGLSNDALHGNWPWLWNKYLYGFGGGTVSYLKAIKSMEASLMPCDNEEEEMVNSMISYIKNGNERDHFCYVSLGCGDGRKDASIIKKSRSFSCYYPIDINSNLIKVAFCEVSKVSPRINFGGYIGDFTTLPKSLASRIVTAKKADRKVFLCLGHTIGNYRENLVLNSIYKVMGEGDYAIISFEKQRDFSSVRYSSAENSDFLLNPFKSIDAFSYARYRFLKKSLVTGLSDVDSTVKSYLFSLGFPNGLQLSPHHIIWTSRYYKSQIESFFNGHKKFELVKIEEKDYNIVVLLKKKINNDLSKKISKCYAILNRLKKEQRAEEVATTIEEYIKSNLNSISSSFLNRILVYDKESVTNAKDGLISLQKEISRSNNKK